ncbi:MAG: UvrD-helicase domain-containing protein, partial [Bacteroidia bacterium]|nr:UvrD-helicase domain-containing protein [Bacteroidia bacterium]
MSQSLFHIFNASAGSGKTFSLVKFYLVKLFSSEARFPHRKILALTFTNKAVNEMKERIISSLAEFSKADILNSDNPLFKAVSTELNWSAERLHEQSKSILETIIHDYAFFEVMTIDKFNQRLIRNFARDLGIHTNFDIELDTEEVLAMAVDNLISKAGTETKLTNTLIGFAIEKSDDDKSFNIAFDFNKMAKILLNENHYLSLNSLRDKSLDHFSELQTALKSHLKSLDKEIGSISKSVVDPLDQMKEEFGSLPRDIGYARGFFKKLVDGNFKVDFDKKWMLSIDSEPLYGKTAKPELTREIDAFQPGMARAFHRVSELVGIYQLYQSIYRNLVPMSVLHLVQNEIQNIKNEQNIVLISEFNPIVAKHLQDQPADFIYERIGERYKHFFIDEFQDTSVLQWNNLVPLIDNALSGEGSSAMIVGDAKQSIYRWRGGQPEQFIALFDRAENPFQIPPDVHSLKENFRSYQQIVEFNNAFFTFLSTRVFEQSNYRNVYSSSGQNPEKLEAGYVRLSFLDYNKVEESHELYGREVLQLIDSSLELNYQLRDICVLVRRKEEGKELAQYLDSNSDHSIISAESLLLVHSKEVQFVIDFLHFLDEPGNLDYKFNFILFLSEHLSTSETQHAFIQEALWSGQYELERIFKVHAIDFNLDLARQLSLYEMVEYIIDAFRLMPDPDAYLQGLLD